jgi:methylglyoxal/glyoxal reductase
MLASSKKLSASSGASLPLLGLGTFKMKGEECLDSVVAAIECGYHLIDTAQSYKNEDCVGQAIRQCIQRGLVTRSEVFVTTKIHPKNQISEEKTYTSLMESVNKIDLDGYVDLAILHWPGRSGLQPDDPRNEQARRDAWKALIRAKREGKVKQIGVSNFTIRHLDDVCFQEPVEAATTNESCCKPFLNQVECHPACPQIELRQYCRDQNILFQAYSSMCSNNEGILQSDAMQSAAELTDMSVHNVLICWALMQRDIGIIPKSTNRDRIQSNYNFVNKVLMLLEAKDQEEVASVIDVEQMSSDDDVKVTLLPDACADLFEQLRSEGDVHVAWNPQKVA